MKLFRYSILSVIVLFTFTGCFEDNDDNAVAASEINDFVWKAMNTVYLYREEVPELISPTFSTDEEYTSYLNSFSSPEAIFESLKFQPQTVDKFSVIFDNYFDLQNQQQGVSLSNGLVITLDFIPGSETQLFGVINQVLNNSVADNLGITRGEIFRELDNTQLTLENFRSIFSQNSYLINFADYDTNGTDSVDDDTIASNGQTIQITKEAYTENPVFLTEIIEVNNIKIGYLMYNGFTSSFDEALNDAFAEFQSNAVDELVLDFRYNGGGSVQTAAYLGSMVTGQFNGSVYSKLFFNDNLESNNSEFLFTNTIENGSSINNLNLNKVYVLTTGLRTASASELVINSLRSYIEVVVVGENTVGKTQASVTIYDSPDLTFSNDVNPNHTYALQPLVANSTNVDDVIVPPNGITPDVAISEQAYNLGILGNQNEPLLAAAIEHIEGSDRSANNTSSSNTHKRIMVAKKPQEQNMFIDLKKVKL